MQLENRLSQKKEEILKKWFNQVINTYPEETAKVFGHKKDPFANPVGSTIYKGLEAILLELFGGMDHDALKSFLDPIVRMRAIQTFSPSDALSFVFDLKSIIRDELAKDLPDDNTSSALWAVDAKIDRLILIAFDIHAACREKIYELKTNEMRRTTFQALERANLIVKNPAD